MSYGLGVRGYRRLHGREHVTAHLRGRLGHRHPRRLQRRDFVLRRALSAFPYTYISAYIRICTYTSAYKYVY